MKKILVSVLNGVLDVLVAMDALFIAMADFENELFARMTTIALNEA